MATSSTRRNGLQQLESLVSTSIICRGTQSTSSTNNKREKGMASGIDDRAASLRLAAHTNQLPQEAALHLLDFLDAVSLINCEQTHSDWRKLASSDTLWTRLCRSEFRCEGGKADYASRWQQEKKRAHANLALFVDFLDEIYFALAGFLAIVCIFVVFPTLLVLKVDGWLTIRWTHVFGSVYALSFLAVLYLLVRLTLLVTLFSSHSSLQKTISYNGVMATFQCVLLNTDCGCKFAILASSSLAVNVLPLAAHASADGYHSTPSFAALMLWLVMAAAAHCVKRTKKTRRSMQIGMMLACAFASSSLVLVKFAVGPAMPWVAVMAPFSVLPWTSVCEFWSQRSIQPPRPLGLRAAILAVHQVTTATSVSWCCYHHHPPLVSAALLALKLDGVISVPWMCLLLDYFRWVLCGPVMAFARHLVHLMVREMPIPAKLRKL